ncbi:CDP-alcohol phosphatidyltransferase family protein [Candidatus Saccharibacteria bacterium]|nr:CDP-alcohol phosphatidyltransferase family protein [Candidatus Saccharibacteria bacterium]
MSTPTPSKVPLKDPPVVREFKWLMDALAVVFFVWWLSAIKRRWPATGPVINLSANIMSVVRGLAAPFIVFNLVTVIDEPGRPGLAFAISLLVIDLVLDGVDGPLARRLDAVTNEGKVIDPGADKLTMLCMAAGYLVLVNEHQPGWGFVLVCACLVPVAFIEVRLVMIAALFARLTLKHNVEVDGANIWGKIKFNVQIASLSIGFIGEILKPDFIFWPVITSGLLLVAIGLAAKSLAQHRRDYRRALELVSV